MIWGCRVWALDFSEVTGSDQGLTQALHPGVVVLDARTLTVNTEMVAAFSPVHGEPLPFSDRVATRWVRGCGKSDSATT